MWLGKLKTMQKSTCQLLPLSVGEEDIVSPDLQARPPMSFTLSGCFSQLLNKNSGRRVFEVGMHKGDIRSFLLVRAPLPADTLA
jgi:hypothetical protein